MSKKQSKSPEQLRKIADKLRQKLSILNSNGKIVSEKKQKKTSGIEINSDSEIEALQLFENVKPVQQSKNKDSEAPAQKQDSSQQIQPSNIRSILRMPMDIEEKEDEAADAKKSKSVSFNFSQNLIFCLNAERKWKDEIKDEKKGKFQLYQQKALSDAIGQYLASNQISLDQFVRWLSFGSKQQKHILRKQKFFSLLASVLPNRSPMSCYKYVVRNFHSLNRQGQWSKQDVEKLLSLVDKFGRKWTLIGKQMGRTSDNVYDKYRSLGEEELQERVQSLWKLRELVSLIIEVERQFGDKFVDHNINKELDQQVIHDGQQQKQRKEHKYNTKKFTFHNIEVLRKYIDARVLQGIDLEKLKWKKIVKVVKTKNVFDCRNKIVQILQVLFRNNQSLDELLLQYLSKQKPTEQSNLNWKKWKDERYNGQQARNRFMILKKLVQGRANKPFKQIYQQIIAKIKKMQEQAAKSKRNNAL